MGYKNPQANRYEGWKPEHFERLFTFFEQGSEDECWLWHGTTNGDKHGTPTYTVNARTYSAALLIYDQLLGLPKTKKFVRAYRTCENRGAPACVNPHHRELKLVDVPKRKLGTKKRRKLRREKRTECLRGHDLTVDRARISDGGCRLCKQERNRKYREERQQVPWHEEAERRLQSM